MYARAVAWLLLFLAPTRVLSTDFIHFGVGQCRGTAPDDNPRSWYEEQVGFDGDSSVCADLCLADDACKAYEHATNHCKLWTTAPQATSGQSDQYSCWMRQDSQTIQEEAVENYLVADWGNERVQLCTSPGGKPCKVVETELRPWVVATDPRNNDVVVLSRIAPYLTRCVNLTCTNLEGFAFDIPTDIMIHNNGDYVVSDERTHTVRRCNQEASCTTVAGTAGSPGEASNQLRSPGSVALDSNENYVVADYGNHRVQLCPANGSAICTTVAGESGQSGHSQTQLDSPTSVTVHPTGDYIIADAKNQRVQRCSVMELGLCITVVGEMLYEEDHGRQPPGDGPGGGPGGGPGQGLGENQAPIGGPQQVEYDEFGLGFPVQVALHRSLDYIVTDSKKHYVLRCDAAGSGQCTVILGRCVADIETNQVQTVSSVSSCEGGSNGFLFKYPFSAILVRSPAPPPIKSDAPYQMTIACTLSLHASSAESREIARQITNGLHFLVAAQRLNALFQKVGVTLVIEDDFDDAEMVQYWYNKWTTEQPDNEAWIYLSPYSEILAAIAAPIVAAAGQIIMLPYDQLPALQAPQTEQTRHIVSTAVPPVAVLMDSLDVLWQQGARTLAFIQDSSGHNMYICHAAQLQATEKGFKILGTLTPAEMLKEIVPWMRSDPDAVVLCVGESDRVGITLFFENMNFNPKAAVILNSQNRKFVSSLSVDAALYIMGPEEWQVDYDPCDTAEDYCRSFMSRKDFIKYFHQAYGEDVTFPAAQAVAAALLPSYFVAYAAMITNSPGFLQRNLNRHDYPQKFMKLVTLADRVGNFWQVLKFDATGMLVNPMVWTSQLRALPTEALLWRRMTELNMTRIGSSGSEDQLVLPIYPRPTLRTRKAESVPCEPGYARDTQAFFEAVRNESLQKSSSICQACPIAKYRNAESYTCLDCPFAMQATQVGQSQCSICKLGSVCHPGKESDVALPNWYNFKGAFVKCKFEGRCLGHNRCFGNTTGILCESCSSGFWKAPRFTSTRADPCVECSVTQMSSFQAAGVVCFIWLVLVSLLRQLHSQSTMSLANTSRNIMRSFINHLHFTAITLQALQIDIPVFKEIRLTLYGVFVDPFVTFPPECIASSFNMPLYVIKEVFALCVLPAVLIPCFVFAGIRVLLRRAQDVSVSSFKNDMRRNNLLHHEIHIHHSLEYAGLVLKNQVVQLGRFQEWLVQCKESINLMGFLLYPLILLGITQAIPCEELLDGQIKVLVSNIEQTCDGDDHNFWVMCAWAGWVVYGLGVPVVFMLFIWSARKDRFSKKNARSSGFLFGGIRLKHRYLIIATMILKAALLVTALLPRDDRRIVSIMLFMLCYYAVWVNFIHPFDARDRHAMMRLETIMIFAQVAACIVFFARKFGLPGFGDAFSGVFLAIPHIWYLYWFLWAIINNAFVKGIAYHPIDSVESWGFSDRFTRKLFNAHRYSIEFDPATMTVDLSDLRPDDRRIFRDTLRACSQNYFKAALRNNVPWTNIVNMEDELVQDYTDWLGAKPKRPGAEDAPVRQEQEQEAKPWTMVTDWLGSHDEAKPRSPGAEDAPVRQEQEQEAKRRTMIHVGFLAAGLRQVFPLIEISRLVSKSIHLKRLQDGRPGLWSRLLEKMKQALTKHSGEEGVTHVPCEGLEEHKILSMEEMLKHVGQTKITVTAEEFYMGAMLCLHDIKEGMIDLFKIKPPQAERSNRHKKTSSKCHEWQQEEVFAEFLQELEEADLMQLGQIEQDEIPGKHFNISAPPEPEVRQKPLPKLLKNTPGTRFHPGIARDQDEVLAENLGLQNVVQVRVEQSQLQEEHNRHLNEVVELRAQVLQLNRKLSEVTLKSSSKNNRQVDTLEEISSLGPESILSRPAKDEDIFREPPPRPKPSTLAASGSDSFAGGSSAIAREGNRNAVSGGTSDSRPKQVLQATNLPSRKQASNAPSHIKAETKPQRAAAREEDPVQELGPMAGAAGELGSSLPLKSLTTLRRGKSNAAGSAKAKAKASAATSTDADPEQPRDAANVELTGLRT